MFSTLFITLFLFHERLGHYSAGGQTCVCVDLTRYFCIGHKFGLIVCTIEPLFYDHPQNHIGVVV